MEGEGGVEREGRDNEKNDRGRGKRDGRGRKREMKKIINGGEIEGVDGQHIVYSPGIEVRCRQLSGLQAKGKTKEATLNHEIRLNFKLNLFSKCTQELAESH